MIYFYCDCCGKKFGISEHLAGRKGLCPDCGTMFTVPAESQPAPARDTATSPPAERALSNAETASAQRLASESPEWGGEKEASAPPAPRRPLPVPSAASPRGQGTRVLGADALLPGEGAPPPPHRRASTSVVPTRRSPSPIGPAAAVPPSSGPMSKASTSPTAAVRDPRPGTSERDATRTPSPHGSGVRLGLAIVAILVAGAVAAWKLGVLPVRKASGSAPELAARGTDGETTSAPSQPPSNPSMGGPSMEPSPPPSEPPRQDPPAPPPTDPPRQDPPPPPTEPPKQEPPPPPPTEPPKQDPPPPPTESPRQDPPAPPPTEPPPEEPPVPEAVTTALEKARQQLKASRSSQDAAAQARALDLLKDVLAAREVTQFLGKLLLASQETPAVRKRAAELLGDGGQADAVPLLERGIKAAREHEAVARAAIAALGRIDSPAAPRKLEGLVRSRLVPAQDELENLYARDAVEALGRRKRFRNIETLMGLYLTLAQLHPGEASLQTAEDVRKEAHRAMLEEATRQALMNITSQNFRSYPEWADWWQANRGTYK